MLNQKIAATFYIVCFLILSSLVLKNAFVINEGANSYFAAATRSITEATLVSTEAAPPAFIPLSTQTPGEPPLSSRYISESEVDLGQVILTIPSLSINTKIDLAQTIGTSDGMFFSEPFENPVWIPDWSVEFGLPGLSMIYGHRQQDVNPKVFSDLDKLKVNDSLEISSPKYQLNYIVKEVKVINPAAIWQFASVYDKEARKNDQNTLMLITCTPWGTNEKRLIILLTLESINDQP